MFLIKEIGYLDKYTLLDNLDQFIQYIKNNPSTLFAKIYGLFSIKLP